MVLSPNLSVPPRATPSTLDHQPGALVLSHRPKRRPPTASASVERPVCGAKREPRQRQDGGKTSRPLHFRTRIYQANRKIQLNRGTGSLQWTNIEVTAVDLTRRQPVPAPPVTSNRTSGWSAHHRLPVLEASSKSCRPMTLAKRLWNESLVPTGGPHVLEIQSSAAWAEFHGAIPLGDRAKSINLARTAFSHTESSLQGYPLENYRLLCSQVDQDGGNRSLGGVENPMVVSIAVAFEFHVVCSVMSPTCQVPRGSIGDLVPKSRTGSAPLAYINQEPFVYIGFGSHSMLYSDVIGARFRLKITEHTN